MDIGQSPISIVADVPPIGQRPAASDPRAGFILVRFTVLLTARAARPLHVTGRAPLRAAWTDGLAWRRTTAARWSEKKGAL